jgi:hypothetical protein
MLESSFGILEISLKALPYSVLYAYSKISSAVAAKEIEAKSRMKISTLN